MQFGAKQQEMALANWGPQSWFYQNLGQPARDIVGRAYGVLSCSNRERTSSQEYLTLALQIFAQKIGADKSHVVHALLTNSPRHLLVAIIRREELHETGTLSTKDLAEKWVQSFREAQLDS